MSKLDFIRSAKSWILVALSGAVLGLPMASMAQEITDDVPIYDADTLNLDTTDLRPHRLLYDPTQGENGLEDSIFNDGVYPNPRIAISLERTLYYEPDDTAHDAIRIRWVSNTHPHTDAVVVDAQTLAIVNEITRAGRPWQTRSEILHIRGHQAHVTIISDDDAPTRETVTLSHRHYYGVMVLPYLFASMNVPDGAQFRLPSVGSGGEGFIYVDVTGPATFRNAAGNVQGARLVRSRHGWGEIDWYVDADNAPYNVHAIWRFGDGTGALTGGSSVSQVVDWDVFDQDPTGALIDADRHAGSFNQTESD